jgi:hypothetical protein
VLAFRFEKERVFAPNITAALGPIGLEQLGYLSGRGDRVADDTATNVSHDMSHRTIAVYHSFYPGVLIVSFWALCDRGVLDIVATGKSFFLFFAQFLDLRLLHYFPPRLFADSPVFVSSEVKSE